MTDGGMCSKMWVCGNARWRMGVEREMGRAMRGDICDRV